MLWNQLWECHPIMIYLVFHSIQNHLADFFWKYLSSNWLNSSSIYLFIFCKFNASDFTPFNSSSTEFNILIALLISSIRLFLVELRVWATILRSSILEQCSIAMIFSFSLSSSLIFCSTLCFSLTFSSSFSLWITVIRLSSLVSRWDS